MARSAFGMFTQPRAKATVAELTRGAEGNSCRAHHPAHDLTHRASRVPIHAAYRHTSLVCLANDLWFSCEQPLATALAHLRESWKAAGPHYASWRLIVSCNQ